MIRAIVVWTVRTVVAVIFGQAALQFFHSLGLYPEQLLAAGATSIFRNAALSSQILENAGWIFAAIAVALIWTAMGVGKIFGVIKPGPKKKADPAPSRFIVDIDISRIAIGDYEIVSAVTLKNVETRNLDHCVVQIDQYSGVLPNGMPFPLTLRTDRQIRANLNGAAVLLPGQTITIPILVSSRKRPNEWFFLDENGTTHFVPANPLKIVLGVYGGEEPRSFLLDVETDANWTPRSSVKPVDSEFRLPFGPGARVATQQWQRIQILEVFALAQTKFDWDFQGPKSLDILDFIFGLHQAGVDGAIKFYGKLNRNDFEELTRDERLVEIDRNHWQDYELDVWKARNNGDNFFIWTLNKRSKEWRIGGFADIHADRMQIMNWLKTEADGYRGHTRQSTKVRP